MKIVTGRNGEKVELKEATATSCWDTTKPHYAIYGKKFTFFALKGGDKDGYWKAEFVSKGSHVAQIEVTTLSGNHHEANKAKVYVGEKFIG